jgi:hypothetical protein
MKTLKKFAKWYLNSYEEYVRLMALPYIKTTME